MTQENTALSAENMEALDNDETGFESARQTYRTPGKNLFAGDTVQGAFVKTEPNKFGKNNYILRTSTGIEVLNSSGSLDKQIEALMPAPNDILRVKYEGAVKLTEGTWKGKEAHQYAVSIKRQR